MGTTTVVVLALDDTKPIIETLGETADGVRTAVYGGTQLTRRRVRGRPID